MFLDSCQASTVRICTHNELLKVDKYYDLFSRSKLNLEYRVVFLLPSSQVFQVKWYLAHLNKGLTTLFFDSKMEHVCQFL